MMRNIRGVGEMRKYELYLIEEIFATYFYGRERKFFNLFKEHSESENELKEITGKQIKYITKPIPTIRLHAQLIHQFQHRSDFFFQKGHYMIKSKNSEANLQIFQRNLSLMATGYLEAEDTLMNALRKTEFNFFAIDIENEQYGWIKPIKFRKYI